ncbi:hypothetical protein LLG96_19115, partial [bacterium]|nr:hypothetical protein [bacterium]
LRLARTAPILFPKTGCDRGAFQRVYKITGVDVLYSICKQCITIHFNVVFGVASKPYSAYAWNQYNVFYLHLNVNNRYIYVSIVQMM